MKFLKRKIKDFLSNKWMPDDWANLGKYAAANKKLQPAKAGEDRIVFMGDSITELWNEKDDGFFKGKPYINRGISGQTTPQMLVRFREDVIDLKPKVVVILAGINDIGQNNSLVTLESVFGYIASMATLAKASNIKVVLATVLPANIIPWNPSIVPAEKVIALNEMIKAFAIENKMAFVDYYTAMVDEKKGLKAAYSEGGVHATAAGYKVMGPLVEKAIAKALIGSDYTL